MLTSDRDAFGHQLYDYLNGKVVADVVEREDGFVAVGSTRDYFKEYGEWDRSEKRALRHVRGRVLDVGCGAGRISLHLQKKGFDVVAVDVSSLAIQVCKLRGVKNTRNTSITRLDSKLGKFTTIVMSGDNFGLFGNPRRAKWMLRKFYAMTEDGAVIIAETVDPHRIIDTATRQYHGRNVSRGKLPGQWKLRVRYKKYKTPWFEYLLVSRREMRMILGNTGWKLNKTIPSKGSSYFAVIRKQHIV